MPQFRIDRRGAVDYVSVAPESAVTIAEGLRTVRDEAAARLAARIDNVTGAGGHGRPLRLQRNDASIVLAILDELVSHGVRLPADLARLRRALGETREKPQTG
jgi:hypothetical protein